MPSTNDHIRQWKHNRAFLSTINRDYHDWMVTAAFYTALHAIDALLSYDKIAVTSHEARNRALARVKRYEKICLTYLPLYHLSRTIRYMADPAAWVPADQVQSQVIQRYLYPIEQSVQRLIRRDLKLDPVQLKSSGS